MNAIDGGNAAGITEKKQCFVISPIGSADSPERKQADSALRHIIKRALSGEFDVERADDSENPGAITSRIVDSIQNADLIVADISGGNANVFYELAIAHGYDRPTVHIQSKGNKIPFDIKDMSIIDYDLTDPDSVELAQERVANAARFAIERPTEVDTPLKNAQSFRQVASSGDPEMQLTARIWSTVQRLESIFAGADKSPRPSSPTQVDALSMIKFINRVVRDRRSEVSDFAGLITESTSSSFDRWIRKRLTEGAGISDKGMMNDVLLNSEMKTRRDLIGEPDDDNYTKSVYRSEDSDPPPF